MTYTPTVNQETRLELAHMAASLDIDGLIKGLRKIARIPIPSHIEKPSHTWQVNAKNMADWLSGKRPEPYQIFTKNNGKMKGKKQPFYIFSALPIVTCPGMGECRDYCYSLKSWRYPQPFFRQLQNTVLIKSLSERLTEAFRAIPIGSTLRLYVDGDIDSIQTLDYWFSMLKERPDIKAYGYSKSWDLFLEYDRPLPSNYVLNLSSGSIHSDDTKESMKALSITREAFIALESISSRAVDRSKDNWTEYAKDLRMKAKDQGLDKVFICPGKCGTCTGQGHACGMSNLNVPVVIGVH